MRYLSANVHAVFLKLMVFMSGVNALIVIGELFHSFDLGVVAEVIVSWIALLCTLQVHLIKYDRERIYIQSAIKRTEYLVEDFQSIEPIFPYVNFYKIVFKDGKEYAFPVGSSKYFLNSSKGGFSSELESELKSILIAGFNNS